jgi:hypothetical protein
MGRPRSGIIPNKPIVYLTERHREMARRLVLGERQCDVARSMGISAGRMSDISRSPVFMEYMDHLAHMREIGVLDIRGQVERGATAGLDILLRVLSKGTEENQAADVRTKVQVAQDLLDREGSMPRTTTKQGKRLDVGVHLTAEDIESIKAAAGNLRASH